MRTLLLFIILTIIPQSVKREDHNLRCTTIADKFVVVKCNPKDVNLVMAYKNSDGEVYGDFGRLKRDLIQQGKELIFACNGGMFMEDLRPLGWYIENGKVISQLNTRSASTNFYLKPNGIFIINWDKSCRIIQTGSDYPIHQINYATQSGPMLTINGQINPKFSKVSTSWNIRNGVGVNQDGDVVFILAVEPVSLYELADAFLFTGCDNSLYLDGIISDFYLPQIGMTREYGYMSVMIAIVEP